MHDYRKLEVWQEGRVLARLVYEATRGFPREEAYGLVSQARRAAVGVPTNLAEGSGRGTQKDYARFVSFAIGSICELETLVILAEDLGLMSPEQTAPLHQRIERIRRMLVRFRQRLAGGRTGSQD
jgi:four helix bundle protein